MIHTASSLLSVADAGSCGSGVSRMSGKSSRGWIALRGYAIPTAAGGVHNCVKAVDTAAISDLLRLVAYFTCIFRYVVVQFVEVVLGVF